MGRLKTLKPRLATLDTRRIRTDTIAERRITGRRLQDRRFKMWAANPRCAHCGRLVEYPGGFELDHKVPLHLAGEDTEENCQILCMWRDTDGVKHGCHEVKTKVDAGSGGNR